ncbi:hypothetical protein [Okeania sp. SIO1H2]|uniref:hypothetical protein n=1 Tax=Okeania sp. SIO1H2 TaxID=2607775 RepID=UPI00141C7698|nr:hypothetical protein [Okeania sp. SIO1H2]NET91875.1 hypothetical protein [Okeania sp. SIO1H2]
MKKETGDRRQETGDRRQETGDRRQETGDRRQETGDRRQETGDRRQLEEILFERCQVLLTQQFAIKAITQYHWWPKIQV